ncbi:glycosyl hydrolase [Dysgonomonas sp. HDW5A]|uniref:glycoside hydrolase family 3 C-terminal domain-containing protein n=1 Tax=Dysgonomonas sp. HDW5A TaxID=2714926 RepID=UPI00140ACAD7|nr:glycoside hydrolase family 3 C-terminal domain-containing protein [Dysgonomonas sp. HDW5A]QIK60538.1 glycosyl hydrolase [Dysgonomonas sp. HDW5A]
MKILKSAFILSLFALPMFGQNKAPIYLDETKPVEQRIEDALSRMTLEEKVKMCHAQSKFSSPGVPRLGIPELWHADGPHGVRAEVFWDEWDNAGWTNDSCIAFPALTALAATWNPEMAALYGKVIGEEARYRKKDVLLGPGVNIYRTPLNGRNFEYMGEDPFLASRMAVPYIKGVQSNGVAACVKHFALNNQEIARGHINVNVSDRALHEIYLPAFKAAVEEAGVWSLMGAYNQYKGEHCCHNSYLLNDVLKGDWKFDGAVIADWGGTHNTVQAAKNGLDIEMGTWTDGMRWNKTNAYDEYYLAVPFLNMLKSGELSEDLVNDKVRRILRLMFRTNMNTNRPWGSFGTEEHMSAGQQIAEQGIVLLQNNNNVLPIDLSKTKKIAVIGENAIKVMTVGGGSSSLKVRYEISPLQGLLDRVGTQSEVVYARGYVGGKSTQQDGLSTGQDLTETRSVAELLAEAVKVAKDADFVVFIGGLNKDDGQDCEGNDRADLGLPYDQDKLIGELAKANKNLAVVLISGNAVAMPWVAQVPAIVQGWYNGSAAGKALASILVGDVNPSGKLPMTFPIALKDNSAHALGEYPGDNVNVTYNEGIFVGYRWADKEKIKPLFSFGHGLSYTKFQYGKVAVDNKTMSANGTVTVTVPVKNVGSRKGEEVVQLYISDLKSSLPRPVKELKGFSKIALNPGEEKNVSFVIDAEKLKFYDDTRQEWVAEPGTFEAVIGASSTDIRGKVAFELK